MKTNKKSKTGLPISIIVIVVLLIMTGLQVFRHMTKDLVKGDVLISQVLQDKIQYQKVGDDYIVALVKEKNSTKARVEVYEEQIWGYFPKVANSAAYEDSLPIYDIFQFDLQTFNEDGVEEWMNIRYGYNPKASYAVTTYSDGATAQWEYDEGYLLNVKVEAWDGVAVPKDTKVYSSSGEVLYEIKY